MRYRFLHRFAVTALLAIPVGASPIGFYKPHLPDFYQHQLAADVTNVENDADLDFAPDAPLPGGKPSFDLTDKWWEAGGGWCCVSAHVNSFYFLEAHWGYKGLYTPDTGAGKSWLELMVYATEHMAVDYIYGAVPLDDRIPTYLRKLEKRSADTLTKDGKAKKPALSYKEFTLGGGGVEKKTADAAGKLGKGVKSDYTDLFDAYHAELCKSQDVTIRLTPGDLTGPWWAVPRGFHVVTGAGVADCDDDTKRTLAFADPDKRNEWDADKKAYKDSDIRKPYDTTMDLPVGAIHYEIVEIGADGKISKGLYAGAMIAKITAISPIPEPGTWSLAAGGLLVLALARRGLRNATAPRRPPPVG
jgi:hypothetical protein